MADVRHVATGITSRVELRASTFSPFQELAAYESLLAKGSFGAGAHFVGTMRDFNVGAGVSAMHLEHYPGMTDKHLAEIAGSAREQWDLCGALLLHRYGEIQVGEGIVVIGCWSAHRREAFEACRFMIEDLKSRAPFWKKETRADGARWVEQNSPG